MRKTAMVASRDRGALKRAVRDKILSLEEHELATAIAHYEAFLHEAVLDERETHDRDDIAVARENADLAAAFDHPVHTHQAKIEAIQNTDFSLTDVVRPGAVVSFSDRHFVVAVSTGRFDVAGTTYMGISVLSPIYDAIEGLKAGEVFAFNGRELVLQKVL
jgi:transcription elongation GreA/GreB family factor